MSTHAIPSYRSDYATSDGYPELYSAEEAAKRADCPCCKRPASLSHVSDWNYHCGHPQPGGYYRLGGTPEAPVLVTVFD